METRSLGDKKKTIVPSSRYYTNTVLKRWKKVVLMCCILVRNQNVRLEDTPGRSPEKDSVSNIRWKVQHRPDMYDRRIAVLMEITIS